MAKRLRSALAAALSAGLLGGALAAGPATSSELPALPVIDLATLLDIAQIELPSEEVAVEIHADFPVDAPLELGGVEYTSITASILPTGGVVTHHATPAGAESGGGGQECKDNFFAPTGRTWRDADVPVHWSFKKASTPSNLNRRRTALSVREAHWNWGRTNTNCDGEVNFRFRYDGPTHKGLGYNGVNTIEFGSLGGGALAVNYTWYTSTRILEVDLRFNKAQYPWSNQAGNGSYNVENVATHELGHQIGLDDLGDSHGSLTMFGRIGKGEAAKTSLGAGDLRGANLLTP